MMAMVYATLSVCCSAIAANTLDIHNKEYPGHGVVFHTLFLFLLSVFWIIMCILEMS